MSADVRPTAFVLFRQAIRDKDTLEGATTIGGHNTSYHMLQQCAPGPPQSDDSCLIRLLMTI